MDGGSWYCTGVSDQDPKKKKCKKAKWLSEEVEALQIAEKQREAKGKGEKERYTQFERRVWKNSKQGEIRNPSSVINVKN